MKEHEASRTLVKSPPELWAECSDASSLSRHLKESFGEIKITRLEPETAVAWEGERASGTVRLEPAGWGTKVVMTATPAAEPASPSASVIEPAPPPDEVTAELPAAPSPRRRRFARLFRFLRGASPAVQPAEVDAQAREHEEREPAEVELEAPEPLPAEPGPDVAEPVGAAADPEVAEPSPAAADPEVAEPVGAGADPEVAEPVGAGADPEVAEPPPAGDDPREALTAALDSLGRAHHRPFSRA